MWHNQSVLLPPVSNREDLIISVSIFDDDTGDPLNLSATVTASGLAFSGSNWIVTIGLVATTSTTLLTIPVPPIGNQLSTLTLTVPPNLVISPGNAVQIADPTFANWMIGTVTSYSTSGMLVCQIGNTFQFEIRRGAPRNDGSGYIPWYDFGTPDHQGALITAALGTGLMITDIGHLQVLIPEAIFRKLTMGTFNAALTMFDGMSTRQVFIANLPVMYGGVTN